MRAASIRANPGFLALVEDGPTCVFQVGPGTFATATFVVRALWCLKTGTLATAGRLCLARGALRMKDR